MANSFQKIISKLGTRQAVIVVTLMVIGLATIIISQAATPTTSIQSESGNRSANATLISDPSTSGGQAVRFGKTSTATCGKTVANYTYQVPFGNAVWNQPICTLPTYSKSTDFVNRLLKWGTGDDPAHFGALGATPGFPDPTQLDPLANLFTREVYLASKATVQAQVASVAYPSNLDGAGYNPQEVFPSPGLLSQHPDATIPWNPAWKTGKGGDNEIFILDDRPGATQGRIYTIWIYEAGACFSDAIFWPGRVCGASVQVGRDHYGKIIDYRTHEGYVSERGVGLSYYATLTTPEEVEAGEIRHALGFSIANSSYGPICTNAQLGTTAESNTCGTALAPATKFEWGGVSLQQLGRPGAFGTQSIDKTIPEGTRFGLTMSYAEIDAWVSSRTDWANNPRRAQTARIFARALKDYGMIVVDTNGAIPGIQMVGGVNPDNATKWNDLGMGPEFQYEDLFKGLLKANTVRVVEPPTLTCADGTTSKNYCKWTSARYP